MRKIVPLAELRARKLHERMRKDLPPPNVTRWVASRKAAVVAAVDSGAITEDEVCARYDLSAEELALWRDSFAKHGPHALLVTKLKHFRNTP
ncbi:DUF1153 domain-containing protein [Pikeienuella piscinae]|uniref:DUF1153 domain-containing protein n=1 Tax=Pikeienuella piscinae TaxID=2748098 RepID=A0A7L5BX46_9RHOB|nr:DUF1153 domain-containing protein [Pikeienuella piscinae]QIE54816.1 DUF1153 domain-containing protein [Pikeienuella piscinae]